MSSYYCPNCGSELNSQRGFNAHVFQNSYKDWDCQYCGEACNQYNSSNKLKKLPNNYFCPACGDCLNDQDGFIPRVFEEDYNYWGCENCGCSCDINIVDIGDPYVFHTALLDALSERQASDFNAFINSGYTDEDCSNSSGPSYESSRYIPGVSKRSRTIALVLCIFLGMFGIHRFYLGNIGMGFLYLITGGLCGWGWIIDIIVILSRTAKDGDGDRVIKW